MTTNEQSVKQAGEFALQRQLEMSVVAAKVETELLQLPSGGASVAREVAEQAVNQVMRFQNLVMAMGAIGYGITACQRSCFSDVWANYCRLRQALGQSYDVPSGENYDTAVFAAGGGQPKRVNYLAIATEVFAFIAKYKQDVLHTTDAIMRGAIAAEIASLPYGDPMKAHLQALQPKTPSEYIVVDHRVVAVEFDYATDTGASVHVDGLCPDCGEETDWAIEEPNHPDKPFGVTCQHCDKTWLVQQGTGGVR